MIKADHFNSTVILTSCYFGSIQYFTKLFDGQNILIEQYDNYSKQTFRNRCVIAGANGPLILSIPVKKNRAAKTLMKDIRIDYSTNWQKMHHRGICSSYGSSPFFEYLYDDIEPFFRRNFEFLIDLNLESTRRIMDLIELNADIRLTTEYRNYDLSEGITDYRSLFGDKKNQAEDSKFSQKTYHQVFIERHGFLANLSILDMLFNTGKETLSLLKASNL